MTKKPIITRVRNWIEQMQYKRAMRVLARHIIYNSTPVPEIIISVDNSEIVFSISSLEQREILTKLLQEQGIHQLAR